MNDNELLKKIEILCTDKELNAPYSSERQLVAWILLTRLQETGKAWEQHCDSLTRFAEEVLLSTDASTRLRIIYLRLVAQVTTRLPPTSYPSLGARIFQAWKELITSNVSLPLALHMDVWSSLEVLLESNPSLSDDLDMMAFLWNFYSSMPSDKDSSDETSDVPKDQKMMEDTLEQILRPPDGSSDSSPTMEYTMTAWHEQIYTLMHSVGSELLPISQFPSILEWITSKSTASTLPPHLFLYWQEWCLSWISSNSLHGQLAPYLSDATVPQLQELLLAHVISPHAEEEASNNHFALRAMAWQTLVALVESNGWNWMLQSSSSPLGSAAHLCTWIRLASGEWRIQLQLDTSPNSSMAWQATAVPIGHGCARLIQSIIQYCIQLSDSGPLPSAEVLLHLRQSLEQTLWTTVEYLSLESPGRSQQESLYTVALRLLGNLLTEVDIFDLTTPSIAGETDDPPLVILQCLSNILPTAEEASLLPGLVHILGDEDQRRYMEALWEPVLEYLVHYWQRPVNLDDAIPWACSCTELWCDLESTSSNQNADGRRRLRLAVVGWMQRILQLAQPTATTSYLALALGCYGTLSQDRAEAPKEHEKRVVLRAMQWCNARGEPGGTTSTVQVTK